MSDNEEFNEDYEQSGSGSDFADFEGADPNDDDEWLHGVVEGTTPASVQVTTQAPAEASSSSTKRSLPPIIHQASGSQPTDEQDGSSSSGERKLFAEFRYPDPHPWANKQFVQPNLSNLKWSADASPFAVLSLGTFRCPDGKDRVSLGLSVFPNSADLQSESMMEFLMDGRTTEDRSPPNPKWHGMSLPLSKFCLHNVAAYKQRLDDKQKTIQETYRLVKLKNNLHHHPSSYTARVITETLKEVSWLQDTIVTHSTGSAETCELDRSSAMDRIRILPTHLLRELARSRGVPDEDVYRSFWVARDPVNGPEMVDVLMPNGDMESVDVPPVSTSLVDLFSRLSFKAKPSGQGWNAHLQGLSSH
ncbi:hypothetical protein EHS25_008369 [Saitozyma podzolica]|uniref:Uncharacterized protein n=1 Tax=Saitozyma podzolica TaxID=1890683 RepID=A0A427YPA1_9TREE|nr:hypothetical protein EHS25_008369 [Saitozyma podzolica]